MFTVFVTRRCTDRYSCFDSEQKRLNLSISYPIIWLSNAATPLCGAIPQDAINSKPLKYYSPGILLLLNQGVDRKSSRFLISTNLVDNPASIDPLFGAVFFLGDHLKFLGAEPKILGRVEKF